LPRRMSVDHPPGRQQREPSPGLGQFNHLKGDRMLRCCCGEALARVALVHIGGFDALIGRGLNSLR